MGLLNISYNKYTRGDKYTTPPCQQWDYRFETKKKTILSFVPFVHIDPAIA